MKPFTLACDKLDTLLKYQVKVLIVFRLEAKINLVSFTKFEGLDALGNVSISYLFDSYCLLNYKAVVLWKIKSTMNAISRKMLVNHIDDISLNSLVYGRPIARGIAGK